MSLGDVTTTAVDEKEIMAAAGSPARVTETTVSLAVLSMKSTPLIVTVKQLLPVTVEGVTA